jgi:hypothetical protein
VRAEGRAPTSGVEFSATCKRSWTPPGKYIIDYFNMVLGNEDAYIRDLQYGVRGQQRGGQGLDSNNMGTRLCYLGGTGHPTSWSSA